MVEIGLRGDHREGEPRFDGVARRVSLDLVGDPLLPRRQVGERVGWRHRLRRGWVRGGLLRRRRPHAVRQRARFAPDGRQQVARLLVASPARPARTAPPPRRRRGRRRGRWRTSTRGRTPLRRRRSAQPRSRGGRRPANPSARLRRARTRRRARAGWGARRGRGRRAGRGCPGRGDAQERRQQAGEERPAPADANGSLHDDQAAPETGGVQRPPVRDSPSPGASRCRRRCPCAGRRGDRSRCEAAYNRW